MKIWITLSNSAACCLYFLWGHIFYYGLEVVGGAEEAMFDDANVSEVYENLIAKDSLTEK